MTDHARVPPGGIYLTQPEYTPEGLAARVEGFVELSATVADDGVPRDVRITQSLGFGLDEEAVRCARQWRVPIPRQMSSGNQDRVKLYVKFELPPVL